MKNRKLTLIKSILLIACLIIPVRAFSQQMTAKEILIKNDILPTPPASTGVMKMTLISANEQTRERTLDSYSVTFPNGDEKRTLVFKSPPDVRNVRFLNINYKDPNKLDEQYIYLPALRKVRKIGVQGSEDKTAAFLGSDFTYADMGDLEIEDFKSSLLGKKTINGQTCYLIEMIPKNEKIIDKYGYGKIVRYINAKYFTPVMNEYYDRDGRKKVKQLEFKDVKKIKGYWVIGTMEMTNLQNDHKTVLIFEKTDIRDSISSKYFTIRFLQRGR